MVAIQHSSGPRWNPPPTHPAVLISCVVVTARQILAGGRGSVGRTVWSQYSTPDRNETRHSLVRECLVWMWASVVVLNSAHLAWGWAELVTDSLAAGSSLAPVRL